MTRQEMFEKHWADMHDLPAETMQQYRWLHQDGYRLPGIAAAYRNFCAGWDACAEEEIQYSVVTPSLKKMVIPYQEAATAMSSTAFAFSTKESKS